MAGPPVVDTAIRDGQYRDPASLGARIDLHQRFSTNGQGWFAWLGEQIDLQRHRAVASGGDTPERRGSSRHEERAVSPPATPAVADGAHVLELGCGDGGFWVAKADRVPRLAALTLTDFSPGMLAATRDRLRPYAPDARFDIVIANHMLYHVPNLHRALREIRRVLRPDGRLYASTNGERHMIELAALIRAVGLDAESFGIHDAFSLERGAAALNHHFAQVERRDYVDALAVSDPEATVRYVASTVGARRIGGDQGERLRQLVTDTIAREGAFRITKSTGLFIAVGAA